MSLSQRYHFIKEAAHQTLSEVEGLDKVAQGVLNQVVLEAIRTYQQKVAVGIEDSASDLLDSFKSQVTKHILEAAAGWHVTQRDDFLFPQGCRFCFTRGENTIVVIEQGPAVRSLKFLRGMQGSAHYNTLHGQTEWAGLSIPYCVFILLFKDDNFVQMRHLWRTAPLRSLDDMLCYSLLPNIHENGTVCMPPPTGLTLCEVCDKAITNFWNSQFNNDLSPHWWSKSRISPMISTGDLWKQKSLSDPMFVLQLSYSTHKTLREVIDLLTAANEEPTESDFKHKLAERIDACVNGLFRKITLYLKKTKFEKNSPADIQESLKSCMKASISELVDVSMAVHHEIDKLASDMQEPVVMPEPVGPNWSVYR